MGLERRRSESERTVVAVGLTGSIGAGKSTALSMFSDLGLEAISADEIVHELYQRPGFISVVVDHFGQGILSSDGSIERVCLAEAVRGKTAELRWLEQATHPLVSEEITRRIQAAATGSLIVCEVPLLFETGFERLFDLVVTIEAAPEVRRHRSIHKFGLQQFGEFENLQASRERRVTGSDMVFVNDGTLDEMRDFVSTVRDRARQMLAPRVREGQS